jgi:hypothetical protein
VRSGLWAASKATLSPHERPGPSLTAVSVDKVPENV